MKIYGMNTWHKHLLDEFAYSGDSTDFKWSNISMKNLTLLSGILMSVARYGVIEKYDATTEKNTNKYAIENICLKNG